MQDVIATSVAARLSVQLELAERRQESSYPRDMRARTSCARQSSDPAIQQGRQRARASSVRGSRRICAAIQPSFQRDVAHALSRLALFAVDRTRLVAGDRGGPCPSCDRTLVPAPHSSASAKAVANHNPVALASDFFNSLPEDARRRADHADPNCLTQTTELGRS